MPSLKKWATQGVLPTEMMGGRDARKEKNDEYEKREKRKGKKNNGIRKRGKMEGSCVSIYVKKSCCCYLSILCPLLWMLFTCVFCICVRGVCPCVVSACLDIRNFYTCLLQLLLPAFHEIS